MNKRLRWVSTLLCTLLVIGAVFASPGAACRADAATSLSQLQNRLNALKQEQAKLDAQLKNLKNQQQSQAAYQQSLQLKIANAQGQIDNLNAQISGYDAQISEKEAQISDAEAQISANFTTLKARLKAIYMLGEASMLDILFSADNVTDFLNRSQFVQAISDHDQNIISALKTQSENIRAEKESIEADRTQLAEAKTQYDSQKQQLQNAMAESERISKELQASQAVTAARQKEINAAFAKADEEIKQWWINYNRQQEENANANKPESTGSFTWPMPGYSRKSNITQYFAGKNNHRGIDISGAGIYGKTIVAADSGVVAVASYNNAVYGIYVQIDHGGGVATLYGHTSGLLVKAGQTVQKGQAIAYVGSSGISTGAHLHFGVLIRGTPVNPLNYFQLK